LKTQSFKALGQQSAPFCTQDFPGLIKKPSEYVLKLLAEHGSRN